jgi:DNA-binding GntR family transcriptional regulator
MANYRFAAHASPASGRRLATRTLTERVYGAIRDQILTGRLRPGMRLVRRELSKRLGVSPMPVTEALLRLERDGLVESWPLLGSRVRPLTVEDVRNDQVLREAIECQAARLCAEHARDADLSRWMAEARRVDRLMEQGDPHSTLGMKTHRDFHLGLASGGGFTCLAEELERVWFRRLMRLNWVKATHYRAVPRDWHQQLVAAIGTRDLDRAEAKMREHVRYGNEDDCEVLRYVVSQPDGAEEP